MLWTAGAGGRLTAVQAGAKGHSSPRTGLRYLSRSVSSSGWLAKKDSHSRVTWTSTWLRPSPNVPGLTLYVVSVALHVEAVAFDEVVQGVGSGLVGDTGLVGDDPDADLRDQGVLIVG